MNESAGQGSAGAIAPEFLRLAQSKRLTGTTHRVAWVGRALSLAADWVRVDVDPVLDGGADRLSAAAAGFAGLNEEAKRLLTPEVVENAGGDDPGGRGRVAVYVANVEQARELQGILRDLATVAHAVANAARGLILDYSKAKNLGAGEHSGIRGWAIVRDLETAAAGLLADAFWLASVASRQEIALAPSLDAARVKRMRARRALGFRTATVNLHESDIMALRRLGLLGIGHKSRDEIENALDAFLAAALATAAEETREPAPTTELRDPSGLWTLRPFLTRLASLVRAYTA